MKPSLLQFLAPAAALALTVGLFIQVRSMASQDDATGFHAAVKDAVARFPIRIGDWDGVERTLPAAAGQLLRPNASLCRHYRNSVTGRSATVLLVQCADSRDMTGHFPPNCYPGHGWTALPALPDISVDLWGRKVPFAVYEFSRAELNSLLHCVIYNVFVLPRGGLVTGMGQVGRAGGDFRTRPFGAAQIQVIFDAGMPETERLESLRQLLEPMDTAIRTMQLTEGGSPR